MKKLMILGGSRYILPVIEAAHSLGIYVITCDYLPNNYAHKYADEYCNISIIDKEVVLDKAKELKIDGIMSFACDPGVVTAAYVAEMLNLPNVGPYKSVCILQNKGMFRKFLADNGFNVPTARNYTNVEAALKDIQYFHWPVIVKPTDSAGSKGVTKVDDIETLKQSIEYAIPFSHCGEFIIEDYIEQEGYSSDSDCFSVNGKVVFSSFSSQRFDKNAKNPFTPAAFSWPSKLSKKNQLVLQEQIQDLIKLLGMKTAIYNIETRETKDGKAYIMEMSPRGGGNRLSECLRYATGVDMITNMVKYSVGIPFESIKQDSYVGVWAEVILHSDESGLFDSLWISDKIVNNIVEQDVWVEKGDEVGAFSAANEAIGTLILKFEADDEMEQVLGDINKYVRVIVNK